MAQDEFRRHFGGFEWPWYMPTVDEYERLIAAATFDGARVWCENADRYFPDKEAMIRWIDQPSLVPLLAALDGPVKDRFRDIVVDKVLHKTQRADGRCFETFRRINVSATTQSA